MANEEQLSILRRGVGIWNQWRREHNGVTPDFEGAPLEGADLRRALLQGGNLKHARLDKAKLQEAQLDHANLQHATLTGANLQSAHLDFADLMQATLKKANLTNASLAYAYLHRSDLRGANLSGANLHGALLPNANLGGADLTKANLTRSNLVEANLEDANLGLAMLQYATLVGATVERTRLAGCWVYGLSVWNLKGTPKDQSNLTITGDDEPRITVDNLKIAQFIYLLLNNAEIRDVIDTVSKKAVLILGRFTPARKAVLDAIQRALRKRDYVPLLFDFDVPKTRDITETITILARMARFIIADLTEPSSIPKELEAIVPTLAVPVKPLLERSQTEYAMFKDYWKYDWVLDIYHYRNTKALMSSLDANVIAPAEKKALELSMSRNRDHGRVTNKGDGTSTARRRRRYSGSRG
jgi:uncharacterized protein YjbI with pentapeptide repeats